MHYICPKDLSCAPYNPRGYTKNFFFSLMLSVCPRDLNFAAFNPCWYINIFFWSDAFHMSRGPALRHALS